MLTYILVVIFIFIIAVICIMNKQRRNDILIRHIAARIKELRHKRGLTQENVRFDLDLNIGRIETGHNSISISTLSDLCDYYTITLKDFFDEIETQ